MGYIIGNIMIIFVTLLLITTSIKNYASSGPRQPGFEAFNKNKFWDTIGFSFYAYEGIGVILPIMKESRDMKSFPNITVCALLTLSIYYTIFGFICYMYFGKN
jgi:amino acid permease